MSFTGNHPARTICTGQAPEKPAIEFEPVALVVTDETYRKTKLWESEQRRAEALALEWK